MPQPSNETIVEMIKGLTNLTELQHKHVKGELVEIKKKQDLTNGNVKKNTKFRTQAAVYGGILLIVVPVIVAKLADSIWP